MKLVFIMSKNITLLCINILKIFIICFTPILFSVTLGNIYFCSVYMQWKKWTLIHVRALVVQSTYLRKPMDSTTKLLAISNITFAICETNMDADFLVSRCNVLKSFDTNDVNVVKHAALNNDSFESNWQWRLRRGFIAHFLERFTQERGLLFFLFLPRMENAY